MKEIEAKWNMDFAEITLEDALIAMGAPTYVVHVNHQAYDNAYRVLDNKYRFCAVASADLDLDEWRLEQYTEGVLTASFHSTGA